MLAAKVTSRFSRTVLTQCRNSVLLYSRGNHQFHSLRDSQSKVVTSHVSLLHHSIFNTPPFQCYGFSSSSSPQPNEEEAAQSGNKKGSTVDTNDSASKTSGDAGVADQTDACSDSDSDLESDLSMDDLVKLVAERDELLNVKINEIEQLKDKVLRTYAETENVMERTRREAENAKKYAIQNFAKSLLDVADNMGRASSVVKESFLKIDASKDTAGAVTLLKTLLEGVEMTEKQLAEVFKKFGVEKYDPKNEQFDPHRDNAVFQVPEPSKPPGTVAVVLKPGYMLYDRILRPAEVGVTTAVENKEAEQSS